MRVLVDTHALLWWDGYPGRLPAKLLTTLLHPGTEILISTASLWEIRIKEGLGKLTLRASLEWIVQSQQANGARLVPVEQDHVYRLSALPLIHRDPFDRMLVAQAMVEGATLATGDRHLTAYGVPVMWS